MINKDRHVSTLWEAREKLRADPAITDSFPMVLSLYGLKVLADSAELYFRLGISVETRHLWQRLRSASHPVTMLQEILAELSHHEPLNFIRGEYLPPQPEMRDDVLSRVVFQLEHLDARATTPEELGLIGEVADEFLERHAAANGLRSGGFYTPRAINRLKACLLVSGRGDACKTVYDPACGVGGTLAALDKALDRGAVHYYGQDTNVQTLFLCAWNLILHGIVRFTRAHGDTLLDPKFLDSENRQRVRRFDLVLSDPPFNLPLTSDFSGRDSYQRFRYGEVRGKRSDYGFLQHILASLAEGGRAAVTVVASALSRSGFEQKIRTNLIHADVLSASISLPRAALPGSYTNVNILVFEPDKPPERRGKVFFVDAVNAAGDDQPLDVELRNRILDVYQTGALIKGFTEIADLIRLEEHDFSLLPQVYVPKPAQRFPPVEKLDAEISELERKLEDARRRFDRALAAIEN
jgi:type I restriction enzyme M protein